MTENLKHRIETAEKSMCPPSASGLIGNSVTTIAGQNRRGAASHATKLKVLDLFSGIGGFSLGLERTDGFETVAFCEIEPFPRRVLAKHWPNVPIYEDVRELTAERLAADGISVDVICGGFPCQDISLAGKGAGLEGERSGLWSEIARLTRELGPRYIIVENVSALLGRGLGQVLGDLAEIGYDAEWHCIPAAALGAPHRRDRFWLVAYPNAAERWPVGEARQRVAWSECLSQWQEGSGGSESSREDVADTSGAGLESPRSEQDGADRLESWRVPSSSGWWLSEPDVGRVAHGVPARVDRLKGLGNAVVPQIPEMIGRAILAARVSDGDPKDRDLGLGGFSPVSAICEAETPSRPTPIQE
jgi:DNA (cytosine-5)-methyltransferase 1